MVIKDKGSHYEITMVHVVNIGKRDPVLNFREYLEEIAKEFDQQFTKTIYLGIAPKQSDSHIILPD